MKRPTTVRLMRRSFYFLLVTFVFLLTSTTPIEANAGPPANIRLRVVHDGQDFQLDFLIPHPPLTPAEITQGRETALGIGEDFLFDRYFYSSFPDVLIEFQDPEGFVSNTLYGKSSFHYHEALLDRSEDRFTLYFDVPLEFKLALVLEGDIIIVSPFIEMTQYDFVITWDVRGEDLSLSRSDVGVISGLNAHPITYASTWIHFIARVLVTLAVELTVLWAFRFTLKKTVLQVLILNIVTQTTLTWGTIYAFYTGRQQSLISVLAAFILGEVAVFTTEVVFMGLFVREHGFFRRVTFALVANTLSLIVGFVLMMVLFNYV